MATKKDTIEELNAKLRFIVGVCLAFTLTGTIFAVLYSLIHVTQPMFVSPNDQKFFELIQPIATFLTGTLSGIMLSGTSVRSSKRDEKEDDQA
jgi:K+-sensing histidine kinase KdpD